jgi:hypothetical protein
MALPVLGLMVPSSLLCLMFILIDSTASFDISLDVIDVAKGISFAYRRARRPVAESASRIVNGALQGFGSLFVSTGASGAGATSLSSNASPLSVTFCFLGKGAALAASPSASLRFSVFSSSVVAASAGCFVSADFACSSAVSLA